MRCKNCGKTLNLKNDNKVCSYCGTKVPRNKKTDIGTIILSAITVILFVIFLYVVYDRFLEDKIKDIFDDNAKISPTPSYSDTSTETGNTQSNLSNGGMVAETDDYIYFTVINKKLEASLYKRAKDDTGDKSKVVEGKCSNISVMSNAIYYTDVNDKLCKIELSGIEKGLVKRIGQNGSYKYVTVVGDWIYYCDSNSKLHKMRPDGNDVTKLSDSEFRNINVIGDKIYGINKDGNLIHVGTDGKKEKTTDIKCNEIVSTSNWLYFTDGTSLFRALPSNLAKEKIADVKASNINIYGDLMYFYDKDAKKVFRMTIEGDNITELLEYNLKAIFVVEKSMFLLNGDDNLMYEYDTEKGGAPALVI